MLQYTAGVASIADAWFIHWPVHGLYGPRPAVLSWHLSQHVLDRPLNVLVIITKTAVTTSAALTHCLRCLRDLSIITHG